MRIYRCLALILCLFVLSGCGSVTTEPTSGGTATLRILGEDGATIISDYAVPFVAGETVLDALQRGAKELSVPIVVEQSTTPYVTSIHGLKAADNSGWVYTVNGESLMVGASQQKLQDGDVIEWRFIEF